jgi:hypothetical protein
VVHLLFFFFPEGEDSGDIGVEGPLKEANLPLIAKVVGSDQAIPPKQVFLHFRLGSFVHK